MANKKKKKRNKSTKIKKVTNLDIYQSIRKDWGEFNPISRVVESKKKYNRKKINKNNED